MPKMLAHILHAEDQLAVAAIVQLELEAAQIGVTTAATGAACLMLVGQIKFDLILLDVTLPDMDGLEVCRRLKASPASCHIPVIFLSGDADAGLAAAAWRSGAADYLLKGQAQPPLAARILAEVEQARARASHWSEKTLPDLHRGAQSASSPS